MKLETVCGVHAVTALIRRNPESVERVIVNQRRTDERLQAVLTLAETHKLIIERQQDREFTRRFEQLKHQGVVALCRAREPLSEPQMLDLLSKLDEPGLVLVLDQITDPHNFGAVLRTADAAGAHCVIAPKNASVGLTPAVRKVASGAAETMPFCRVANLARSLAELQSVGFWVYGAAGETSSVDYGSVDYTGSVALVMGAEGKGLRRLTRDACDGLISIPMAGTVESLNVSVATGVCLYEVVRQRSLEKSGAN